MRNMIQSSFSLSPSLHMATVTDSYNAILSKLLFLLFLVMAVGPVSSDLGQDRKECQKQLVSLSPCLPFVEGDSRAPTSECCALLRNTISESSIKCLCILVKDRNDPNLGVKINATLALTLPSICHAPANVSNCPALLHLAPNSTGAQVFEQYAANTTIDIPTSSSSSARGRKWAGIGMRVSGISLWLLISVFLGSV